MIPVAGALIGLEFFFEPVGILLPSMRAAILGFVLMIAKC